ncbi:MAG: hypothetical protein WCY05_05205 [Candidatus Omnitrophota bacterium]
MSTYQVKDIIDGEPTFEIPLKEILKNCKRGGAIQILDAVEYVTDQQRRWYKGICLPHLAKYDENQESIEWWDTEVKRLCGGLMFLKKEIFITDNGLSIGRLTTKGVGVGNMTAFVKEILAKSVEKNWGITPPDKELRK